MFDEKENPDFTEWFYSRSSPVQEAIQATPPGWYLRETTGQTVMILSYSEEEDGSCGSSIVFAAPDDVIYGVLHSDLTPIEDSFVLRSAGAAFESFVETDYKKLMADYGQKIAEIAKVHEQWRE